MEDGFNAEETVALPAATAAMLPLAKADSMAIPSTERATADSVYPEEWTTAVSDASDPIPLPGRSTKGAASF